MGCVVRAGHAESVEMGVLDYVARVGHVVRVGHAASAEMEVLESVAIVRVDL